MARFNTSMGLSADQEIEAAGDDDADEPTLFGKFVQMRASKQAQSALGNMNVAK